MREVNSTDEVVSFCRERGWIGPGLARAELLAGGVSNVVYRVEAGEQLLVFKQSRPRLRTRDDWFSDVSRVWREVEVMEALHDLLPPLTVPHVVHTARDDYAFVMTHAPRHARVWKEQLLAGQVDLATASHAGRVLGHIHECTARQPEALARFADRTVFVQLRVDPFYRRVQQRRPEVAETVEPLVEELACCSEALCHGDFSPKNILTHEHGFTLVDYETAHRGDPTMDLGFFLSHLLLKAARAAPRHEAFFALTRAFWQGYAEVVTFRPVEELMRRGIGHLGVCLLARIDGTSPVDYIPEEARREAVRALGRSLLLGRPGTWDEVLALAGGAFGRL